MGLAYKIMSSLINVTKWLGMIIMFFMMAFIAISVISRALGSPLIGDVEIVQYLMVALIMFSLPYTQFINAHISIGLIVDKLNPRIQAILDFIAYLIITTISWTFSWIFIKASLNEYTGVTIKSTLLSVPNYPFKFIIALGFFTWGLVSIQQILKLILSIIDNKKVISNSGKGGDNQ